jgi:hypothetical protein
MYSRRYPFLVTKLRVLIYSGDIDACVPNLGSQMWTSALAKQGVRAHTYTQSTVKCAHNTRDLHVCRLERFKFK